MVGDGMKALHKDFWMEIRKSKARFISIFLIVALGVAFFSGIQASSPDMRYSGDAYYEAAKLDGATGFKAATKITIPLLMPTIKVCATFALVGSLRVFDLVYVMTGGGPNDVSEGPATLMYDNLFVKCRYGYGSAQAFFIVFECLLFSFLLNLIFKKSEENASMI